MPPGVALPGLSALAQHQHRNVRMRQNVLGFAAQQQALDAFAPVRGHDDEVTAVLARGFDDGLGHQVGLGQDRADFHPFTFASAADFVYQGLVQAHHCCSTRSMSAASMGRPPSK